MAFTPVAYTNYNGNASAFIALGPSVVGQRLFIQPQTTVHLSPVVGGTPYGQLQACTAGQTYDLGVTNPADWFIRASAAGSSYCQVWTLSAGES